MKSRHVLLQVIIASGVGIAIALFVEALRAKKERDERTLPEPIAPGWDSV